MALAFEPAAIDCALLSAFVSQRLVRCGPDSALGASWLAGSLLVMGAGLLVMAKGG